MKKGATESVGKNVNLPENTEGKLIFPLVHPKISKADVKLELSTTKEKLWSLEMSISGYLRVKNFCFTLAAYLDNISPPTRQFTDSLTGNYNARKAVRAATLNSLREIVALANEYQAKVYQASNLVQVKVLFQQFHSAVDEIIKHIQHPEIKKELMAWQQDIYKPTFDKLAGDSKKENLTTSADESEFMTVYVALRGVDSTFSGEVMKNPDNQEKVFQKAFMKVNEQLKHRPMSVYENAKQCIAVELKGTDPKTSRDIVLCLQVPKNTIQNKNGDLHVANTFVPLKNIESVHKVALNVHHEVTLQLALSNPIKVVPGMPAL